MADPVRILHLIKSLGRGGAEVLLAEGLAVADRARFEFEYGYFLPWKDAVVPSLLRQGVRVTCFDARSNPAILLATFRVARHIRRNRIDLIHAHLPLAGVVARLAGRLTGIPVVYSEHNLQERYHVGTRLLNRLTWRSQERAVAVSAEVAESIRTHLDQRVPVQVILNGVNVETFAPVPARDVAFRAGMHIPPGDPLIGTIAVFRIQKRLDDWIDVARRVSAARPNAHFVLVGDGPERERIEASVSGSTLEGRVHFAGLQEDVRPYLAEMDVYLMTSQFEGLPVALLEAMAFGVPPVVTDVGGIPELVRAGINGVLAPVGAVDYLAQSIVDLLDDPARRRDLGRAARESVVSGFSMERMQRDLEAMYERVLDMNKK